MNKKLRRFLEIVLLVAIVALSVAIFCFRDYFANVGEVGYIGLFLLCFLANSTVLLPAPSLMIAASCALILNPFLVAVVAALGSTLGEFVGYAFGKTGCDVSPRMRAFMDKLCGRIRNPSMLIFILALLPLPLFDVAGIYSGASRMGLGRFFLLCFAGKFLKMLVYTRMYDLLEWALGYLGEWGMPS